MTKFDLMNQEISPKQTRKSGKVPICIYCKDYSKLSALNYKEFYGLLLKIGHEILSTVFLFIDCGEEIFAIIKEIQIHPITEEVVHVDFFRVKKGQEFSVPAKIIIKNSEKAPFVLEGGMAYLPARSIKILCTTDNIKGRIECDVSTFHKGDVLKASDESWQGDIKFVDQKATLVTIIEKS